MAEKVYYATGRRKEASAKVFLKPGKGKIVVNKRPIEEYLKRSTSLKVSMQSLELAGKRSDVDLMISVRGGGEAGQAGAIRHGVARALCSLDETLRPALKKAGFLTRDPREVERKKYGQKGARARFQYSKR
ncbi:MAG: 30S ribosomal protein S9 [Bdellovibrionales bacterium CG10_big_fil_rev_8_21_14_0_10_45_34]|nr:MAG: 30S ribosomal protein S9 [Bdellovibrionales bacterium CG10_big_fil_rev_8_21_14_0_10_45_34]